MPLTLTLPMLLFTAGMIALVLLGLHWPRVRSEPSWMRLAAEVGITVLALFALLSRMLVAARRVP